MKMILIMTFIFSGLTHASSLVSAEYSISRMMNKNGKSLVSFVESAAFYEVDGKQLHCIQEAIKAQERVKIQYDYETYVIRSCRPIR